MSLLSRATARKAMEQSDQSRLAGTMYVPLENRSTWTMDWLPEEAKALAIPTFFGGVRWLAETFAMLPLFVYRRLDSGGKDRATDHPLYDVLHDEPNPEMSSFIWRELVMQNLATWGNHYSEIVEDFAGRKQLWPLRPDRMAVRWNSRSQKEYIYTKASGERVLMAPGSVFHVPGMGADGLKGYGLITLHRKTFELHDAARDFGTSTFKNNARPAMVLSHPKTLSDGAIDRLAGQMDELRGSRGAGKTIVMEEGLTLHEVGIPPEDAQYMETRVFQKREIATILKLQAHKLNDMEHATFTNIEEQNQEFIQDTMQPWFSRFEGEGKRQLLQGERDHFIGFLVLGYLRGRATERANALQVWRQNGIINADDWNEIEDRNPLPDGLGQDYWMPVNMAVVGDAQSVDASGPPQLTAIKSAEVRCPDCNHILGRATPPYELRCRWCKKAVSAA